MSDYQLITFRKNIKIHYSYSRFCPGTIANPNEPAACHEMLLAQPDILVYFDTESRNAIILHRVSLDISYALTFEIRDAVSSNSFRFRNSYFQ